MTDAPVGWGQASLADVVEADAPIIYGILQPGPHIADGVPYVRPTEIQNGRVSVEDLRRTTSEIAQRYHRAALIEDDVLLSIVGTIGKVAIVPGELAGGNITQSSCRLRPAARLVTPEFLAAFLRGPLAIEQFREMSLGTAVPRLNLEDVRKIRMPLPPLAEQRQIVAKLDALTTCMARARADLDRVIMLSTRYRNAVLAAAFRGQLTGGQLRPTKVPDTRCWDLPTGWTWELFPRAATIASNLIAPSLVGHLPHIAPDNIEARTGKLLAYRTIAEDAVVSPKHHFRPGQVIYSKIRPHLRKAILVDFEGACSADMYPLDPGVGVDANYLTLWLISEDFADFTIEHEGRTVLPKINQAGLNKTPFPMPPVDVQRLIAAKVKVAFAEIDRLVAEAAAARRLLDRLDESILAKAFRGELVPQDPADEPASALLERIRAERAGASAKVKRGRRAAA